MFIDYKSQIARRPAAGLTLIEVLISIFVLAVGLLGVAALLPVGSQQVGLGARDQRTTDLASRAFDTIKTQGMLRPNRWLWISDGPYLFDAVTPSGTRIACPVGPNPTASSFSTTADIADKSGFYDGCIVQFISGALQGQRRRVTSYDAGKIFNFTGAPGDLYPTPPDPQIPPAPDAPFPTAPKASTDVFVVIRNQPFAIDPHLIAVNGVNGAVAFATGMPRITLTRSEGTPVAPMGYAMADSIFVSDDDLVFEKPTDPKEPPIQLYIGEPFDDTNGNGVYDSGVDSFDTATQDLNGNGVWDGALKRQFAGDYSWLATFAPAEGGISASRYNVSIVVFHKRDVRSVTGQNTMELTFRSTVGASFGGGDAKLSSTDPSDFEGLRGGQYVLAMKGYADNSVVRLALQYAPIYRWYRIIAVGEPYADLAGKTSVDVVLKGPDWRAVASSDLNLDILGVTTGATIYEGVVGVFQRTMEVENLPVRGGL